MNLMNIRPFYEVHFNNAKVKEQSFFFFHSLTHLFILASQLLAYSPPWVLIRELCSHAHPPLCQHRPLPGGSGPSGQVPNSKSEMSLAVMVRKLQVASRAGFRDSPHHELEFRAVLEKLQSVFCHGVFVLFCFK